MAESTTHGVRECLAHCAGQQLRVLLVPDATILSNMPRLPAMYWPHWSRRACGSAAPLAFGELGQFERILAAACCGRDEFINRKPPSTLRR